MTYTVKGIVLGETAYKEHDKIVTVLTDTRGKISVYAHGVRNLKNRNFTSVQRYSYSEFTITEKNDGYVLKEGTLIESFYDIRKTLEGASLAAYIAEVAADIAPEEEASSELLRLVLNSFHLIAKQKKPIMLIKSVFELRAASEAGFCPDLVACSGCGKHNIESYYFDAEGGTFQCEECFKRTSSEARAQIISADDGSAVYVGARPILIFSRSVYAAMRFVVFSKQERIFSFELKDGALDDFAAACEKYFIYQMGKSYRTLDFFHMSLGAPTGNG